MLNNKNPFILSGYTDELHFCDRKNETSLLIRNAKNNINTTLFAIRRIGKTGLIRHVFHTLNKNKKFACIYVDIYATRNLKEFTNMLATAIYQRFPEKRGIGKQITDFIKLLRPVISYDPISGNPEVSLDLGQPKEYERSIQQIFNFLDAQKMHIVFAIDEFQQICTYPEKNTEALLRTYIQPLRNVSFVFCGSNQKIMHEIFNNHKRPFYASCSNMNLGHISNEEYAEFIQLHFKNHKRNISKEALEFILEWTYTHTYYTQFLCNRVFATGIKNITLQDVLHCCEQIHKEQEGTYYQFRSLLTGAQWELLRAIAKEEKIGKLHQKQFVQKHKLGTTSTISRSIEALLDKELVYKETKENESYYMIGDKFLMRWLQRK
jgi:uncharacterized protein